MTDPTFPLEFAIFNNLIDRITEVDPKVGKDLLAMDLMTDAVFPAQVRTRKAPKYWDAGEVTIAVETPDLDVVAVWSFKAKEMALIPAAKVAPLA